MSAMALRNMVANGNLTSIGSLITAGQRRFFPEKYESRVKRDFQALIARLKRMQEPLEHGQTSKETMVDNLFEHYRKTHNDFLLMNLKTISEHLINTKQLDQKPDPK